MVPTLLFPKPPCPRAPLSLLTSLSIPGLPDVLSLSQVMNRLPAGLSRAQVGQEGCSQGEGRPALARAAHTFRKEGVAGVAEGPAAAAQASLFSMAFYSYVILLLTHIGIGAVAHGGGGQRWAWMLSEGARGEPGQRPPFPQRRQLAWPRDPPLLLPSPLVEGLLDPITALTRHPRLTPITRLGPGMGLCPHRSG